MTKESMAEKFLEASGLQKARTAQPAPEDKVQEMEQLFKGMMEDVKKAVVLASQAHGRGESMIESLKKYCKETLPGQMVEAIDEVAEQAVKNSLKPLDDSVGKAVADINQLRRGLADDLEACRQSVQNISWNHLMLFGGASIFMGLGMALLVRCEFIGDKIDENKRYEVWGRKVEQVVEKSRDAKAKQKFYDAVGGRP